MISLAVISSATEAAHVLIASRATAEDHAYADRRTQEAARHHTLLARAALRDLVLRMTQSSDWSLRPGPRGKPEIFAADGTPGPHISLSHTRGLVACVVSTNGPVGIDVEHWRERNFIALADYAFGPEERDDVRREGAAAFYRIWALREAVSKMTGAGVASTIDGGDHVAGVPKSGYWATQTLQLFYGFLGKTYSLALASPSKDTWPQAFVSSLIRDYG